MSVLRTIPGRRWLRFGVLFGLLLLVLVGCALPEEPEPEAADLGGDVEFTLRTSMEHGLAFVGVAATSTAWLIPRWQQLGDTVTITLINGDGMAHDLTVDAFGVTTGSYRPKIARRPYLYGRRGRRICLLLLCRVTGRPGWKASSAGEPLPDRRADIVHGC